MGGWKKGDKDDECGGVSVCPAPEARRNTFSNNLIYKKTVAPPPILSICCRPNNHDGDRAWERKRIGPNYSLCIPNGWDQILDYWDCAKLQGWRVHFISLT